MPDRTPYEEAALAYCAPRGIRLSEFLEVWSDGDQWAALDWQAQQARKCEGCGQNLDETTGPGTFDTWNADVVGQCDGCRALARKNAELSDNDRIDPNAGIRLGFRRDEKGNGDGGVDQSGAAVGKA